MDHETDSNLLSMLNAAVNSKSGCVVGSVDDSGSLTITESNKANPCGNNKCNGINSGIDECIKPLIKALNDCGMETVASCCGHGSRPGSVIFKDGRELVIFPDYESARKVDHLFPDIHGNEENIYET